MKRKRHIRFNSPWDIPAKANRILNLILIGIALIIVRVWHLSVVQHDEKLEASRKPQKRLVIEPAKRGTIRDRYNTPMAINKIQFNAGVLYSQIRQIPSIVWKKENGKRVKTYRRKEYIAALSKVLADELQLDSGRVEDLIHSKAALYNNVPLMLKEDISEKEYYRLRMLEKDWAGIDMRCVPKRHYPLGKVAGDILGYMGAISKGEYEAVMQEIKALETYLAAEGDDESASPPLGLRSREEAECRLNDLLERAYTVADYVGKSGIEGRFEEMLRGFYGRRYYYSDARGNFLKELPDSKLPQSGKRILLTLSAELQEYAENLLVQNEKVRVPRVSGVPKESQKKVANKSPWIKGGAIVVMDPKNGELLAMASVPRYDPNDFIASGNPEVRVKKHENIRRWFETEGYVGEIWDQVRPLSRERYNLDTDAMEEEEVCLTWERYLEMILPKDGSAQLAVDRIGTLRNAVELQNCVDMLMELTGGVSLYSVFNMLYMRPGHVPFGNRLPAVQQEELEDRLLQHKVKIAELKRCLDLHLAPVPNNYDKVLVVDLCRLAVDGSLVSGPLLRNKGETTLSDYRQMEAAWTSVEGAARKIAQELFRHNDFAAWRTENQQAYIKKKRLEEKTENKKYPKPYLDLLDEKEAEMFREFWGHNRWRLSYVFLTGRLYADDPALKPYEITFAALNSEIVSGAHRKEPYIKGLNVLRKALNGLPEPAALAFLQTFRNFSQRERPLFGRYRQVRIADGRQLEKHLAGAFYALQGYGYARSLAFRQAAVQGSIFKLVTAYEALMQQYTKPNGNVKSASSLNPLTMTDDSHMKGQTTYVGYDAGGKPIPQLYKGGRIPRSHRSGIGKLDIVKALEVSSNPYFSLLAIDQFAKPDDLAEAAKKFHYGKSTGVDLPGEISGKVPNDLECNRHGLYAMAIGQHTLVVTPLQTATMLAAMANGGSILKPKIISLVVGDDSGRPQVSQPSIELRGEVPMPKPVRDVLLEGMRRALSRSLASIWGSLSKLYRNHPEAISDFVDLRDRMLGKSSTAESVEHLDLDLQLGTNLYNHIWFGGIVYENEKDGEPRAFYVKDKEGVPELIVVVYLRYGAWGRDAAPLAAQIAQKWREIKRKSL